MSFNNRTISFSEFKTWAECPKHHKLSYLDGLDNQGRKETKWEWAAPFGTAAHEGVQLLIAGGPLKEAVDLFRRTFIIESRKQCVNPAGENPNNELMSAGKQICKDALEGLNGFFGEGKWVFVANEHQLMVPLAGQLDTHKFDDFKFKGFIDTIIRMIEDHTTPDGDLLEAGTICIIDQKTCGWGWQQKKKNDAWIQAQLILYKHFYSVETGILYDNIKTFFMLLKRKPGKQHPVEIFQVKFTSRRIINLLKKMEKALVNISKGFAPPLGKSSYGQDACFFCPFKQTKFCK